MFSWYKYNYFCFLVFSAQNNCSFLQISKLSLSHIISIQPLWEIYSCPSWTLERGEIESSSFYACAVWLSFTWPDTLLSPPATLPLAPGRLVLAHRPPCRRRLVRSYRSPPAWWATLPPASSPAANAQPGPRPPGTPLCLSQRRSISRIGQVMQNIWPFKEITPETMFFVLYMDFKEEHLIVYLKILSLKCLTVRWLLPRDSPTAHPPIHSKSEKVCGTAFSVKKICGKSA